MSRIISSIIPGGTESVCLYEYLSSRFTYFDADGWRKEITEGKITLNGSACPDPSRLVRSGDALSYDGRGIQEPDVDRNFSVLYEDEFAAVIDKPGDLPVHPAGRYFNNTLTMIYESKCGVKIFPVHRLDRETSGIILCAKSGEYAGMFSKALASGKKEYLAVVHGCFPEEEIRVDVPIGKDLGSEIRKKRKAFEGADESALTVFRRESVFGGFSLVRCRPETGRLHQIRVHLNFLGFPITGDKMYRKDERCFLDFISSGMSDDLLKRLILPRCALHAARLKIYHPFQKKEMIIESPIPKMFTDFMEAQKTHG